MKNLVLLVFLLLTPALISCAGFTPVHAKNSAVSKAFPQIQMIPIKGRSGFTLSQEIFERGGIKTGESGKYQLQIDLKPARRGFGIRVDNVATRYQVQMTATWLLLDEKGTVLTKKTSVGTTSFDSAASPYASQVAELDAENRAVAILTDAILDQLGYYFIQAGGPK